MALSTVGSLQPIQFASERPTVIEAVAREIFVNETPLFARLRQNRARDVVFTILSDDVRGRSYVVGTGDITNSATTLPIADSSPFLVGDVLEIGTERLEVTADPPTATTLTVKRGVEGTTAAAHTAGDAITLIGNSRTGDEIDQSGSRNVRTSIEQYIQTFQMAVQVGGLAEAVSSNTALPPGASSVFGQNRAVKLTEIVRDIEYTSYYGIGQKAAAAGDRAKQKGLKTLIKSANVKTNGGASYTKASFIADSVQKIYDAGGMPDAVLCSTDFLSGLETWAPSKTTYISNDTTRKLGVPVESFVFPLNAKPITFIPSLQLKAGTAVVLTSEDLSMEYIRPLQWMPRGSRGDRIEADWIGDYCIKLGHPQWHAWVSGITSYA